MNKILGKRAGLGGFLLFFAAFSAWAVSPPPKSVPQSQPNLIECVKSGDMASLGQLLRSGADPNERDGEGMTALHYAAYKGNAEAAKLLAAAKADLNARDSLALTPLHAAAFEGRTQVVSFLLRKGASAGARDAAGNTPLHYAVLNGHPEAAEALLTGGADPLAANTKGQNPAQIAQAMGDQRMIDLFNNSVSAARNSASVAQRGPEQKKPVRTYTNEDLAQLRQTSNMAFQEGTAPGVGGETGGSNETGGTQSSPEEIADAYGRIDRLINEKRDLESRLPALQKNCDEFKQRERGAQYGTPSKGEQAGAPAITQPSFNPDGQELYREYHMVMDRERKEACGPLAEAQSRLSEINAEIASLRATISEPAKPRDSTLH